MSPSMDMKFEFEVYGDVLVRRRLTGIERRAGDMSPGLLKVVDLLIGEAKYQFATEGAISGGWQPLAASTLAAKRRAGLDMRILRATGALEASLTVKGHPDQEVITQNHVLIFRSKLRRHIFHQRGTRTMPARPPLAVREEFKREAVRELMRHLMAGGSRGARRPRR